MKSHHRAIDSRQFTHWPLFPDPRVSPAGFPPSPQQCTPLPTRHDPGRKPAPKAPIAQKRTPPKRLQLRVAAWFSRPEPPEAFFFVSHTNTHHHGLFYPFLSPRRASDSSSSIRLVLFFLLLHRLLGCPKVELHGLAPRSFFIPVLFSRISSVPAQCRLLSPGSHFRLTSG